MNKIINNFLSYVEIHRGYLEPHHCAMFIDSLVMNNQIPNNKTIDYYTKIIRRCILNSIKLYRNKNYVMNNLTRSNTISCTKSYIDNFERELYLTKPHVSIYKTPKWYNPALNFDNRF